ncbi:MAG: S41 family peptidase [Flavisolibacter sp.]|jgi:hypothetical protein
MNNLYPFVLVLLLCSCMASKNYNPSKKFSPNELQDDYRVFREVLEESHPSLYWYTPKDSVDRYFEIGSSKLQDSLTEYKFRNVLSYVVSSIHCGHTSIRPSKDASRYAERVRSIMFPLSIKAWDDTVVVTSNLSRKDTTLMRGSILKSIDGRPISMILDTFFKHISADGYNTTHKYQTVSNSGVFRNMYGSIYGLKSRTPVEYYDSAGILHRASLSLNVPFLDSNRRRPPPVPTRKETKNLGLRAMRNMHIDSTMETAFLEVNTFTKENQLRKFFRSSFRTMRKEHIKHLVVDMRGNGGGNVTLSNLLTKYIADTSFKIADSLYAVSRKSHYKHYISSYFLNRLFFIFMTKKKDDGLYHFRYFENKYFKPKKKNHFSGDTYIIIGGNTFSAAALFAKALIHQKDVVVVGEETGGGAYGNTAWLIPDVTLPHSKVRFRLPLFRLVIDSSITKGHGVIPEVEVKPTVNDIRNNTDYKMDKVMQLIREKRPM